MAMAMANYPFPLGGHPNGRYRQSLAQASSSTVDTAGSANVGASQTHVYPGPISVEEAGIRAGEIIAFRAWDLGQDGFLHSVFMEHTWMPGAIERATTVNKYWGAGLHAFKTLEKTKSEYSWSRLGISVVYGEVALWGEVIEHERGYRSEFALIRSILSLSDRTDYVWRFWKKSKLDILRERYGVSA